MRRKRSEIAARRFSSESAHRLDDSTPGSNSGSGRARPWSCRKSSKMPRLQPLRSTAIAAITRPATACHTIRRALWWIAGKRP